MDQLIEALSIQVIEELEEQGRRLIGQILFEKEYITALQVEEVLAFLGIRRDFIATVQQAANTANSTDTNKFAVIVPAVEFDSEHRQIGNKYYGAEPI